MPSKMGRFSLRNASATNVLALVGGSALLVGAGCYAYRTRKQHRKQLRELEDREQEQKKQQQQQQQQQQQKQQKQQRQQLLGELTRWHEEGQQLRTAVEPPVAQAVEDDGDGDGPGSAHEDEDFARGVVEAAFDPRTSRARVASSPGQSPIADVGEPFIPKPIFTATGGDEGSEEGSQGGVLRIIDEAVGGPLHGAEEAVNTIVGAAGSAAEYMKVGTASNVQKVIGVAMLPFRMWGGGGGLKG